MIIFYLSFALFIVYAALIVYYWLSWNAVPEYIPPARQPVTALSVIIPARNEQENIIACLNSVCSQAYPPGLVQIIPVDDCSTDNTWQLLNSFQNPKLHLNCIRLNNDDRNEFVAHKKKAILTGIKTAVNDVVVTTDADCTHSREWLRTMASFYEEKGSLFIAAPVIYDHNASFLEIFQALDFLVLQGITAASVHNKFHSMCNGANLAYEKKVFEEMGGFDGVDRVASGDDMLLMRKIQAKFPDRVQYLKSKNAIVFTHAARTWKEFFNQRLRWASKARFYKDIRMSLVLILVYLFNLSFLALVIAAFWSPVFLLYAVGLIAAKTLVELPFVWSVAKYFGQEDLLVYFPLSQPLHIIYTIAAGFIGQFKKYQWKGRTVR